MYDEKQRIQEFIHSYLGSNEGALWRGLNAPGKSVFKSMITIVKIQYESIKKSRWLSINNIYFARFKYTNV